MTRFHRKYLRMLGVAAALWICNGQIFLTHVNLVATAEADPGVDRRSNVGVGARGVGAAPAPGVGVGAPGVGAAPAPGVGTPANRGGPVKVAELFCLADRPPQDYGSPRMRESAAWSRRP
jgi:hypothetical protein